MRVHISKSLYAFFDNNGETVQLIRDDGKSRDFMHIKKSELKDLRQAIQAIETGDLTEEERNS